MSLDSMMAKVKRCEYVRPSFAPHMTICIMEVENGFILVGKSAPADPENFDEALGMQFAHEDCVRQMWPFEGYALRERMSGDDANGTRA